MKAGAQSFLQHIQLHLPGSSLLKAAISQWCRMVASSVLECALSLIIFQQTDEVTCTALCRHARCPRRSSRALRSHDAHSHFQDVCHENWRLHQSLCSWRIKRRLMPAVNCSIV